MKNIIYTGVIALFLLTGCSTRTSPMVTFDTSKTDFSKTYKMGEDCRITIPYVSALVDMVFGEQGLNARTVALENGITNVKYFELKTDVFSNCVVVYGE